jgi:transcription-repair coupling factor (superfamily II helicase)
LTANFPTGIGADKRLSITGLRSSSAAMLAAWTAAKTKRSLLCVLPTERQAELFEQDLGFFTELPIVLYPGYDTPPYTPLSPDPVTVAARLSVLYRLATDSPSITVTSSEALLRRVIPKSRLTGSAELIIRGEEVDQNELVCHLVAAGYESASLVQNIGDFSVRGGIVDIFPPGFTAPVRLDFFGDVVESLRTFDPITQRSLAEFEEAVFLPASNILFPDTDTKADRDITQRFINQGAALSWKSSKLDLILEQLKMKRRFPGIENYLSLFYPSLSLVTDYLPPQTIVCAVDPLEIAKTIKLCWERIQANYEEAQAAGSPVLPSTQLFLSQQELDDALNRFQSIQLHDLVHVEDEVAESAHYQVGNHKFLKQEIDLQRKKHGLLLPLIDKVQGWLAEGDYVILACRSDRHSRQFAELLKQHGLPAAVVDEPLREDIFKDLMRDQVLLVSQSLSEGFDLPALRLHVISESELFGVRSLSSRKKIKKHERAGDPVRFEQLSPGDVVVHSDHGIGLYEGLTNLVLQDVSNDFLQISYADKDKLYVPVDRIHSVSKYKGVSDKIPKLDRLGGKSWDRVKKKVKEAVWAVAQDLLELYAKRELQEGYAFSKPSELYFGLEESFPYDETPGQSKAIQDVVDDLTSEKPMDRLLCGDVGYGKTEVAVRAAFKVIEDGFQVAVLVPTTVLAEQHGQTFKERLADFPVRVESLSRFRTQTSQKQILKDLAAGRVDVVIGTHRLLSRDVSFKRLGLLIVDEEHRFGVSHKEKIKRLRSKVDVLTLTATPIPRTLQMSLLGVRDLSVIATAPEHRRPVKTFMARYDDLVIKEAVTREMLRNGQTFIVHNRVQSIHEMAQKVSKLVPEARVAVGHGQMPSKKLEEIMVRFVNREFDVLVCTTIIESGLDIANANTIIINRADRLGLAEIYQLRGRVGRGSEQSYAYLLVPSLTGLTKDAKDRLRALMDCSELGGGFKLAMSDLQIRGGGNILGVSQSGHIEAVGYDLYLDLLQKTVTDLKQRSVSEGAPGEDVEPEVRLQVSAYIPERYMADADQRYIAYRRISGVTNHDELWDIRDELRDRYGELAFEVQNLFEIVSLKIKLRKLKIIKLEQGKDTLVFSFLEHAPIRPESILQMMDKSKEKIRFTPDARLIVRSSFDSSEAVFQKIEEIVNQLQEDSS